MTPYGTPAQARAAQLALDNASPEECTYWEGRHDELAGDLIAKLDWVAFQRHERALRAELADWLNSQRDKYILEDV